MKFVPVVGRQALYLQNLGENLALATQAGEAPNQRPTAMLPPEFAPTVCQPPPGAPRGATPRMDYGPRLAGANSIAVRVSAAERGITDPRVATVGRVQSHNKFAGAVDRPPLRPFDVPGGPPPIVLASNKLIPIQAVHLADGHGHSSAGHGELVPVRAGDPLYRPDGKPVQHIHELRDVYQAYHLADVDMEGIGDRRAPYSSDRAVARQDQEFAQRCVDQGLPVRVPDPAERHELVVQSGVNRMVESALRFADDRGAPFVLQTNPELLEARFSAVSRPPVVELPDPGSSLGVDERASSIARAVSQAALFASLSERAVPIEVARVGTSELPGPFQVQQPPSQVVQRVAAHAAERPSYLDQAHLDRASLVASYAALNAVTAMGATYAPGPEAQDDRCARPGPASCTVSAAWRICRASSRRSSAVWPPGRLLLVFLPAFSSAPRCRCPTMAAAARPLPLRLAFRDPISTICRLGLPRRIGVRFISRPVIRRTGLFLPSGYRPATGRSFPLRRRWVFRRT